MRNISIFRMGILGVAVACTLALAAGIVSACGDHETSTKVAEKKAPKPAYIVLQDVTTEKGSQHPHIDKWIARLEMAEDNMDDRKANRQEYQEKANAIDNGTMTKTTTHTAVYQERCKSDGGADDKSEGGASKKVAAYRAECTCALPAPERKGLFGRR